ncbi:ISAs1 family transposase [Kineosporia babensis]|uniref:ISAs1 family transposase n=1 Tax=Kineosporia babensis TaxID=499548 RepID=A0A9X1NQ74_9ACTN|nr:ISAs1 family transposase [Kineosporia babensis]
MDGKTVRGARTGAQTAPHLVAALDHATGVIVGQLATAAKSNEIPTVRTLLATFDLNGVVVTVDAMHTQTDTAEVIIAGGGNYVFTVKLNQPTLYAACKALPWSKIRRHTSIQKGHGRRACRTIKVIAVPAWITFTGAAQVAQVRRTVTRPHPKKPGKTKKTIETVYIITSADHHAAPPDVFASWIQNHWRIENQTHWVRDVDFDEDRSRVRTGNGPHTMATLRNTAINLLRLTGTTNIAAGLRHHANNQQRPINLALTGTVRNPALAHKRWSWRPAISQLSRMRCRSSGNPALPYMCRFRSLIFVFVPSVGPLLYSRLRAAVTAAWSWRMPVTKLLRGGCSSACAASIQPASFSPARFIIM